MADSLEQRVGAMLFAGFEGLTPPDYILEWLAAGRIGGVILFSRNVASPAQLADLTAACRAAAARPLLIAVDQEGGRVARLRTAAGFSESPGALALGAADSEALAERVSAALAAELRALGINWNLAPVVDIAHRENPVIGTRALGSDPARVGALAAAQIRGFQAHGVAATAKHFPGHGNTPLDTHVAGARVDAPLAALWERDLAPFRAAVAAGVDAVMVAHVTFTALDDQRPATLAPAVVQGLLRERIGYDGLVCTDCMEMRAVRDCYGAGESAVLAALAGSDVIFFSHTRAYQEEAYAALLAAARSGRLPAERVQAAAGRVQALSARRAVEEAIGLDVIGSPPHLALMREAARAGTVLLRAGDNLLPLRPADGRSVALVEFASHLESEALERGADTSLAQLLRARLPQLACAALPPPRAGDWPAADAALARARQLAASADLLVLATRSAHLWPDELARAQALIEAAPRAVLVCLASPYDAALPGADAVICTCGDSAPSLEAAADALLGRFVPVGRLPVALA
ncbi:MAG: beta-N-acetylhexosaminidase [Aggregatilineales bacterium]